jgi:PAS domain S-box-containing protein
MQDMLFCDLIFCDFRHDIEGNVTTDYYRRIRLRFMATVISVLLVLCCLFWWQATREREMAISLADRSGSSYTAALSEHADHVFAEVDILLKDLTDLISKQGSIDVARTPAFHQILVGRTRNELQFSSIQVLDRDGNQVASSVKSPGNGTGSFDPSSYRHHRDTSGSGLFITLNKPTAPQQAVYFTMSRAIRDRDGQFNGLVLMIVDSSSFEKLYRELDVGSKGRVILATVGGEILAAVPAPDDAFKMDFKLSPLISQWLPAQNFGIHHVALNDSEGERIIVYRKLDKFPVMLVISYSRSEVLAAWRDDEKNQGIIALVLILLTLSIAYLFLRQLDNLESTHLELQLQKEELQIKAELLDTASDAILLLGTDGRFEYFNAALQNMTEYSREELLERGLRGIEPPEYASLVQANIRRLLEQGEMVFESAYLCKSGTVLPIEVHARVSSVIGRTFILSIVRDITERKAIERQLMSASLEWQNTFDAVEDSIWLLDMERRIIRANKASQTIFGKAASDIIGLRCCDITCFNNTPPSNCPFDAMLENRKRASRQLCRDNTWYEVSVDPIFDETGSIVRAAHIVKNIDGLKNAERREQARSGILERIAGGEPLPQLLEHICRSVENENQGMLCSILLVSEDGKWLVNGAAPSLPESYVSVAHHTPIKEGAGSCGTAAFRRERVVVEDIDRHPFWRGFVPVQEAGLRSCWSEPIISSSGQLLGTIAIYHRIPASPGVEELATIQQASVFSGIAIERSKGEAERTELEHLLSQAQKMEAIGHLSGGIAHDFNNLLTPILIYSEMLKRSLLDNDKLRSQVDAIIRASGKARDLTQQLLGFGRKQIMQMKVVDLNEVIITFDSMVRRTLRENISLSLQLSGQPAVVRADAAKMEQVLLNLILNSQDAIAANGSIVIETGQVLIDDEYARRHPGIKPGRFVFLSCTDNGCGMGDEILVRIFEPFFSTKGAGHGTGLGLANVYGIIKQHNGSITAASTPGIGSTFKILLPYCDESPGKVEVEKNAGAPDHSGSAAILLVEDNEMVRVMANDVLEGLGYTVYSAENPERALILLESIPEKIDLVITDVIMPGMSGPQLFRKIAALHPEIDRVLYMSGYANNAIDADGELDSGLQLLQKPFTVDELMVHVKGLLQRDGSV